MDQKEITAAQPLLNSRGNLACVGFARRLYPLYNKQTDLASRLKTKEWDYYYIGNQHFALALTIADNGYMGLDSISFLDFDQLWEVTRSRMQGMTLGNKKLPATSEQGSVSSAHAGYALHFENDGTARRLYGFMKRFRGREGIRFDLMLDQIPEESMVICTPFDKPGHFYFNQKINPMRASGTVTLGRRTYRFKPEDSFATLDWGRGIWTYDNTWYWSSLSARIDGQPFGFNLGYGFGDTSAASENMLFYQGKAHKLDRVVFAIPQRGGKDNFLGQWTFRDNEGRLDLTFYPILDRKAVTDLGLLMSDQNQVFGRFTGSCVLDDGTVIHLQDSLGFAEKVRNRW